MLLTEKTKGSIKKEVNFEDICVGMLEEDMKNSSLKVLPSRKTLRIHGIARAALVSTSLDMDAACMPEPKVKSL